MSKVKDNLVTTGLSGKLGKHVVFRLWSGATFMTKAPVVDQSSVTSELRIKNMIRFKAAVRYAKKMMDDPDLKLVYESRRNVRQTAYARALQDFYAFPEIEEIDVSNFTGEADSFIRVYATDGVRVTRIRVRVEDGSGNELETGFANQESNNGWWKFVTAGAGLLPEGYKVIVSAYNMPGNETVMEMAV